MVRRAALILLAELWLALGLGCAAVPDRRHDEAALRQLAQARWQAILAEDWPKVQEFYPPELRASQTLERVRHEYAIQAKRERCEIVGVYFPLDQPNQATVVVKQWFDTQGTVAGFAAEPAGTHDELWEKRDGKWWFIQVR